MFTVLLSVLFSCSDGKKKNSNGATVIFESTKTDDTLFVSEIITERSIGEITSAEKERSLKIDQLEMVALTTNYNDATYLSLLKPNGKTIVSLNSQGKLTTNQTADSLLNYLWKSNLDLISKNNAFIFTSKNTDSVRDLFEQFRLFRKRKIKSASNNLNDQELSLLNFQNNARTDMFLIHLGETKGFGPKDPFFDFIDKVEKPSASLKTLPDIYLEKFIIDYSRKNDTLPNIETFTDYIGANVASKDLSDFLNVIYIKTLIERPSKWPGHQAIFDDKALVIFQETNKNNAYNYLINNSARDYFRSQKGEKAFNFRAEDLNGNKFRLADLKGKIVFIDVWATWCAPCLKERPNTIKLAKKYSSNPNVAVLLISVDEEKNKWKDFLKEKPDDLGKELFIRDGMSSDFGAFYNIKEIPRYILIDGTGTIVKSNIKNPLDAATMIDAVLIK